MMAGPTRAISCGAMSNFVYASATALNAIIRTDLHSDEMKIFAADLRKPRGIAFAPDNTLYLVTAPRN